MNNIHKLLSTAALLIIGTGAWAQTSSPTIGGNVFGGGRMADVNNTSADVTATIDVYASTITGGVFGGNDITGAVKYATDKASAKITIHDKCNASTSVGEVYGGGNGYYKYKIGDTTIEIGKITDTNKSTTVAKGTEVTVLDTIGNTVTTFTTSAATTYGGLLPTLGSTNVIVGDGTGTTPDAADRNNIRLNEVYGGAKNAYVTGTSGVTVYSGTVAKVFAGNNVGGTAASSSLTINGTKMPTGDARDATAFKAMTDDDWAHVGDITTTDGDGNYSGYGIGEAYGGGNAVDVLGTATVTVNGGYVKTLFGGNNLADMQGVPSISFGTSSSIYIQNVYGGGNAGDMKGTKGMLTDCSKFLNSALFTNTNYPVSKVPIFVGTDVQVNSNTLYVNNVYGGCRSANVDNSTLVHINVTGDGGYVGTVYGGSDIAGSVGYNPGKYESATTVTFTKYDHSGTEDISFQGDMTNTASDVILTAGTVENIFGGGNGAEYAAYQTGGGTKDEPWVVSTTLGLFSGTVTGNIYGGGNMATVGHVLTEDKTYYSVSGISFTNGQTLKMNSYLLMGNEDGATSGLTVKGAVYGGGRMANILGTMDIYVKDGVKVNELYAGNDIAGHISGDNRGTMLGGYTSVGTTLRSESVTDDSNYAARTFSFKGDALTSTNAQVYVRIEDGANINTLFGGGNGYYKYGTYDSGTNTTSIYAYGTTDTSTATAIATYSGDATLDANKPTQTSTWLDIKGTVGTSYGGGNNADIATSNTYITNGATIGTAYAGGNAATVTTEANLWLNCDNARGIQAYVDGSDATKIPNVGTIFGGNNVAAMAIVPRVYLWSGSVKTVYGGGNAGDMTGYEAGAADLSQYIAAGAFDNLNAYASTSVTPENLVFFYSTQVVVDKDAKSEDNSLAVGTVYGGCKAANVDRSSYVLYRSATYMGDIYGGCDIAGKVGKSGNTGTLATAMPVYAYDPTAADPAHHLAYDTNLPSGLQFFNTASYVRIWGGTVSGTIYGGGNGAYDYTSSQYSSYASNKPAVFATGISLEGGTAAGNVYGGGNNADVGSDADSWHGTSYLLIGKTKSGVLSTDATGPVVSGKVYAGCKMSDMYGIIDVIVKAGSTLNELYAGNDIAGQVKGKGRATSVLGSTFPTDWTTALYGSHNAFDGTSLTDKAQVYVRIEGAGKDGDDADRPAAKINTVFGGGNGYYTYGTVADGKTPVYEYGTTNLVATYMGDASTNLPSQNTSWLDISGQVGTVYEGGNAADNNYTNVCLYGSAVVGTTETKGAVYGGCKSANVTHRTNVLMESDNTNNPTVNGNVFGGCDISGNVGNCSYHTCDGANADYHLDIISVGANVDYARVDIKAGTVTGRVFGGGNGLQSATGAPYYTATSGDYNGLTYNSGDFSYPDGSTYAGKTLPQVQNTWVIIGNATIGPDTFDDYTHTLFSGGQGMGTRVWHNAYLTAGDNSNKATINGTVYGGSYAGIVNTSCDDCTKVTISNAAVTGDVYGGSYGNDVLGKIYLTVEKNGAITTGTYGGATSFGGGVYAANNAAGQPHCDVTINYASASGCENTIYGGGNKADYYGNTHVVFTTGEIGYIYGGGDNAPVYGNTTVEVLGGVVCHDVFGGGNNGAVLDNPKTEDVIEGNTTVIVRNDCLQVGADGEFVLVNEKRVANRVNNDDSTSDLTPNTVGKLSDIIIEGNVYGGGNKAPVKGRTTVQIGSDCSK